MNIPVGDKLLLIISNPAKAWGESILLKPDDDKSSYKSYCISNGATVVYEYKENYCFALLSQLDWNDKKKVNLEQIVTWSPAKKNAANIYIFSHITEGPNENDIISEIKKFDINISTKHIKRFSHVYKKEYQPVKDILTAAAALKQSPSDDNNKTKFADAFKAALDHFIVYSAPYHLFAIQFLLQALYLKNTTDNGMDNLKNTLRAILCKEKIETEFNGLKETNTGIVDENLSADLLCTLCTLKDELDNAQKVKAALDALSDYLKSLDKPFYVKTDL